MENHAEYTEHRTSDGPEAKRRKIDEVIIDNLENSAGTPIIKQEEDERLEINTRFNDNFTDGVIYHSAPIEEDTTSKTCSGLKVISISKLGGINIELNNNDIVDQARHDLISFELFSEKIKELERNMARKVSEEMSLLKKSWEENNCKCKFIHKQDMDRLTLKIDELKQEITQQEQQKELLMNEKSELQEILNKERNFRLQVSAMLNTDNIQPKTEMIVKDEPRIETDQKNSEQKIERTFPKKSEKTEALKSHEVTRQKESKSKDSKTAFRISKSIRDKKPRPLSRRNLADEMHERDQRRYNIIMTGMRNIGPHSYDEIVDLLWRASGTMPRIANFSMSDPHIILRMLSLTNKYAILSGRNMLKSINVTIDNDLTRREDDVQRWLNNVATDQEKKGKIVEVRFLKIKVDGKWWVWSEEKGDLVHNGKNLGLNENSDRNA